jgi:hypothetical protein
LFLCPAIRDSGNSYAEVLEIKIVYVGRRRKDPEPDSWRKKLQSVFFELAELNREFERRWERIQDGWRRKLKSGGKANATDVRKRRSDRIAKETSQLEKWFEEKLVDINKRHTPISYNPIAYNYLSLDRPLSDSEGIREYIHFHRHGESLHATELRDAQGDLDAWDKISRTEKDYRILAFGKGPIAPFQEDVVHRQLLQLVICYERERMTADDLAECFDRYCACGKENHDPDALRKMRDRYEAELSAK